MTLTELQEETKTDETLQHLIEVIRTGEWNKLQLSAREKLKQFANVLTVNAEAKLILRGTRIVIPSSLQQRAVEIAHEKGIVKTKKLLREKGLVPRDRREGKKHHPKLHSMPSQRTRKTPPTAQDVTTTTKAMAYGKC